MGSQDYEGLVSLYHGIFVYCGIAALVFLCVAALLFIVLKIPRVFMELTGRGAKKAIARMEEAGSASGDLNSVSRQIGDDGRRHRRGRTGALGTSKLRRKSGSLSGGLTTEKMAGTSLQASPEVYSSGDIDGGAAPTDVLSRDITGAPSGTDTMDSGINMAFPAADSFGFSETVVLNGGQPTGFTVLRSIMEIHTDEVI